MEIQTSGTVTSTITTGYDSKDRPMTTSTAVTGLASSSTQPAITTRYDDNTGSPVGTASTAGSASMSYDNWGRRTDYTNTPTNQTADSSATTYNQLGQVVSVVDGNGQTSYTYNGTDANGQPEYRDLLTAVKVKVTNGTEYTSTGAYDDAGILTLEKLPGNLIRRTGIDIAGDRTNLTVNGQGTDPNTGALVADQPWIGWSSASNALSQIVSENDSGNTDVGASSRSDRAYSYDQAGRLTQAQDHTGLPDANGITACQTRTYIFDANGNRTGQKTIDGSADGSCATTGGTQVSRAFDTADRLTAGGNGSGTYTYDQLGRQTIIPATDTPHPDRGDLALTYYDSDAIKSVTQNGQTYKL